MADGSQGSLQSLLVDLDKQMRKKQTFEWAITALTSIMRDRYSSASTTEHTLLFDAVCKAARLLQSRYTARGFWLLGLTLFEEAGVLVTRPHERKQIRSYLRMAQSFLGNQAEEVPATMRAGTSSGFLFEGQLTVDREPPPPSWLVAQNALRALLANSQTATGEEAGGTVSREGESGEAEIVMRLRPHMEEAEFLGLSEAIAATLEEEGSVPRGPPPASKEEVAKLRVVAVTEEVLKSMDEGTECAVCREGFVSGDSLQEMPCKHTFHPDCLKPWLDEHNSCPICRYEMKTDDLEYERKKETDKEAEEERKGAANALPGGEFMYI